MKIEIIGMVASAIVLVSMLFKDMLWLRIVNILGSALFAVYGFLVPAYSTAALNIIMIVINLVYIILILRKKDNKTDKELKN